MIMRKMNMKIFLKKIKNRRKKIKNINGYELTKMQIIFKIKLKI